MTVTVGRTRLKIHPLALLFPVTAAMLGTGEALLALGIALTVHETAHLLAARALGVGIEEIRLMPFGGAIRLENPYALSPGKLFSVAAAGPVGSLLTLLSAAALAHWRVLSPRLALLMIHTNLVLALFNLLPALPLDGGRMLWTALSERLGRSRAAEIGIISGRIVAGLLLALGIVPLFLGGRLNLSPVFAAVFLVASAGDERRALGDAQMKAYLRELAPLTKPISVRMMAVDASCAARLALRAARADALTLYAVYENSRLSGFTDDKQLLRTVIENDGDMAVGKVEKAHYAP